MPPARFALPVSAWFTIGGVAFAWLLQAGYFVWWMATISSDVRGNIEAIKDTRTSFNETVKDIRGSLNTLATNDFREKLSAIDAHLTAVDRQVQTMAWQVNRNRNFDPSQIPAPTKSQP